MATPAGEIHTPARHYPKAMNTNADWYRTIVDPDASLSARTGFAEMIVDVALRLGWIPNEEPQPIAGCACPVVAE
jgi:hypothetical protein